MILNKTKKIMNYKIIEYALPIITVISAVIWGKFDSKKKSINHTIRAIIRTALSFPISYGMHYLIYGYYMIHYYSILYSFMLLVIFWMVFDLAYNYFKGVTGIWYIGKKATLDRIGRFLVKGEDGRVFLAIKGLILYALFILYTH